MGVIIRVVSTGEVLDITGAFALENTISSAFFSTDGSQAIPVSLPITAKNTTIFGYANRPDRRKKANKEIEVIVSKGSYSRKGTLHLEGVSKSESSYSARIVYDESNLYNLQSQLKVNELPNLPVIYKSTDELIREMQELLTIDDPDKPLTVFKVLLKHVGEYKVKLPHGDIEYDAVVQFALNDFDSGFGKVNIKVKDKFDIARDGKIIPIKSLKGIGITPFVHAWYVIDLIADHYGYQVGDNPFKTHYQLRRLTLLNNTADAIVADRLFYSDLMPHVTITEFFQFLWARFGAKVFIDGNTNTLNIKLLRDSITYPDSMLLPISGEIDIEEASPKQLRLTAARNLPYSDTDTNTIEEFYRKYNNTIGDMRFDSQEEGVGGIMLDPTQGLYYNYPMSAKDSEGNNIPYPKLMSSIHFDWDKKEVNMEYEEITSPDECITMALFDGRVPYYAVDFALYNSVIEIDLKVDNHSEPNKLAACWDMGQYYYGDGIIRREEQGYKFGSIFPFVDFGYSTHQIYIDIDGNRYNYALMWIGKYGCFENFWKEYDAVLRHSNDSVTGKLNLQTFDFSTLDPSVPYIIGNHKMLLKDFKYIVGTIDVDNQEFNAMTLGLYEPYDLAKEQSHPKPDPILYYWAIVTTKNEVLEKGRVDVEDKYKTPPVGIPASRYRFISCTLKAGSVQDTRPPKYDGLAYLPPSQKDFDDEIQRGSDTHPLKAVYVVVYEILIITNEPGEFPYWEKTIEDVSANNMTYTSHFQPKLRD